MKQRKSGTQCRSCSAVNRVMARDHLPRVICDHPLPVVVRPSKRQAICIPYCCSQNAPSNPIKRIVTLPDNKNARDKMLKELFIKHVCEDALMEQLKIKERTDANEYGDITVDLFDDLFMFVHII